ncbi:hypothetical protein [Algoriphagus sp. SE2]|uniref:hypothetical protein n=1 Tax=Algoriphagus sp. SE2 TaxID=3141536 RepID=UPI00336570F1
MPTLEELGLRSFLTKNQDIRNLGISFFLVILIFKILQILFPIALWTEIFLNFGIGFVLFFLISNLNLKLYIIPNNIILFSILSSFLFAIYHVGLNYTSENLGFLLVSVIPFFISGLIFCHVRIKYGLIYSLALHSIFNFTIWILNLVFD